MRQDKLMNSDMRRAMFKLRILFSIKKSEANAYMLWKMFNSDKRHHGLSFGKEGLKNRVYNTVKSLERSGHIKASEKVENGRLKKYYKLTSKGNSALKTAKKLFQEHAKEMILILGE